MVSAEISQLVAAAKAEPLRVVAASDPARHLTELFEWLAHVHAADEQHEHDERGSGDSRANGRAYEHAATVRVERTELLRRLDRELRLIRDADVGVEAVIVILELNRVAVSQPAHDRRRGRGRCTRHTRSVERDHPHDHARVALLESEDVDVLRGRRADRSRERVTQQQTVRAHVGLEHGVGPPHVQVPFDREHRQKDDRDTDDQVARKPHESPQAAGG